MTLGRVPGFVPLSQPEHRAQHGFQSVHVRGVGQLVQNRRAFFEDDLFALLRGRGLILLGILGILGILGLNAPWALPMSDGRHDSRVLPSQRATINNGEGR